MQVNNSKTQYVSFSNMYKGNNIIVFIFGCVLFIISIFCTFYKLYKTYKKYKNDNDYNHYHDRHCKLSLIGLYIINISTKLIIVLLMILIACVTNNNYIIVLTFGIIYNFTRELYLKIILVDLCDQQPDVSKTYTFRKELYLKIILVDLPQSDSKKIPQKQLLQFVKLLVPVVLAIIVLVNLNNYLNTNDDNVSFMNSLKAHKSFVIAMILLIFFVIKCKDIVDCNKNKQSKPSLIMSFMKNTTIITIVFSFVFFILYLITSKKILLLLFLFIIYFSLSKLVGLNLLSKYYKSFLYNKNFSPYFNVLFVIIEICILLLLTYFMIPLFLSLSKSEETFQEQNLTENVNEHNEDLIGDEI